MQQPHPLETFVVYLSLMLVGLLLLSGLVGWLRQRGLIANRLTARDARVRAEEHKTAHTYDLASGTSWFDSLIGSLHLLVIGHTGGGKTTLVHAIATQRARSERVIVCDPDAAPGLWPGCEVYGYENDFRSIDGALVALQSEVAERRRLRGRGERRAFAPVSVVIDEYADVTREAPTARALVEDVLRRGRKLGIRLVIGVQDQQVRTMGFEGASELRKNFSSTIELIQKPDKSRIAVVAGRDGQSVTYDVPTLPDPEQFVVPTEAHRSEQPGISIWSPVPVRSVEATDMAHISMTHITDIADGDAVSVDIATNATAPDLLVDEMIRTLYHAEWSMNRIAHLLTGAQQKRLARIRAALADQETRS